MPATVQGVRVPRKRGRKSKAEIAAAEAREAAKAAREELSDDQILKELKERFDMLGLLTEGTSQGSIRSLIASGAPGVGKSYTVLDKLEATGVTHEVVRAGLSAVNLYMLAYRMRERGSVIVLDDADTIFHDEEALNVLKAICDSSIIRRVNWLKESQALGEDVPQSFEYYGSCIFISNLDWQAFVDDGRNKFAAHFEALMDRSLYLDLRLHSKRAIMLWIKYIATTGKVFAREGVDEKVGKQILAWLDNHVERLRSLSIRTLLKCCELATSHPTRWQNIAKVTLLRNR